MKIYLLVIASVLVSLSVPADTGSSPQTVNESSIMNPGGEWLSYGRTYREQRFSPLDSVNRDNVDELDLVWSFKFDTARGMEATPIVHDGVIYISTGWSHVHAIDARSGEEIWHYDGTRRFK